MTEGFTVRRGGTSTAKCPHADCDWSTEEASEALAGAAFIRHHAEKHAACEDGGW